MVGADVYAFAIVTAITWGFVPILIKRGLSVGGSALQATVSIVFVDTVLFWAVLVATAGGAALVGIDVRTAVIFLGGGAVGTAVGRLASFVGVRRVGASVNTAGLNTRPLFATIIALIWLGEPVGSLVAGGIVILTAGLVVLALSKGGDITGWRPWELIFPIGGALAFAFGNVVRRFGLTTTEATTVQAIAINESGALVALTGFVLATGRWDIFTASRRSHAYFAVTGGLVALGLFTLFEAFDRGPVAIVDPLVGTSTLVTTVLAYFLLGDLERVTRGIVAGAVLVVVGATLITLFG